MSRLTVPLRPTPADSSKELIAVAGPARSEAREQVVFDTTEWEAARNSGMGTEPLVHTLTTACEGNWFRSIGSHGTKKGIRCNNTTGVYIQSDPPDPTGDNLVVPSEELAKKLNEAGIAHDRMTEAISGETVGTVRLGK